MVVKHWTYRFSVCCFCIFIFCLPTESYSCIMERRFSVVNVYICVLPFFISCFSFLTDCLLLPSMLSLYSASNQLWNRPNFHHYVWLYDLLVFNKHSSQLYLSWLKWSACNADTCHLSEKNELVFNLSIKAFTTIKHNYYESCWIISAIVILWCIHSVDDFSSLSSWFFC